MPQLILPPELQIALRPAESNDLPFFNFLYVSSRLEEVWAFGFDGEQQRSFLQMQFAARQSAYQLQYPEALDHLIVNGDERVGRLITNRSKDVTVIVDLVVAPQFRRRGISSQVIRSLQEQAESTGCDLVLRVDKSNLPALHLYRKLGFIVSDENQILYSMTWTSKHGKKPITKR